MIVFLCLPADKNHVKDSKVCPPTSGFPVAVAISATDVLNLVIIIVL